MKYHPGKHRTAAAILVIAVSLSCAQASSAQEQLSAADSLNARNHVNKGNYLLTRQQFQAALTEYQQALELDPMNSVAKANIVLVHNNWGIMYFHQKKYDEARNEWNESLKLSPSDHNAKNNLQILKTTLAKMPPAQHKPAAPATTADGGASSTPDLTDADSSSGAKIAEPAKQTGSQTAQEDNRGVVILSQPSSNANTTPVSNTDAAAMSTSGAAMISSPSKSEASTATPATTSGVNSTPEPVRPNNTIYSNTLTPNQGTAESPFTANPLQSAPVKETVYGTANNDFKQSSTSAPSPAPTTPSTFATNSATFATAPVTNLGTLEGTLGEIEIKVYGSPKKDIPILQRLEKLEQDTNSKVGTGGIADRIQALAKSYGI